MPGESAGRGLKVNRPEAERSHPGMCPVAPTQFSPVGPNALIGPLAWSQLKAGRSLADSAFAAEELKSCGGTAIF